MLGLSNGARAGLTGFVAGLARQVARHNVTINNLLPGPFLTDRLRSNAARRGRSRPGAAVDEVLAERAQANPPPGASAIRRSSARPARSCAARSAGFIVGQNLLLDGGAFNSTMA